jgi:hypothetical protein
LIGSGLVPLLQHDLFPKTGFHPRINSEGKFLQDHAQ